MRQSKREGSSSSSSMRARALIWLLVVVVAGAAASLPTSVADDTIDQSASITGNQTLVSAGGVFELGFFSPPGSADGRTYLGIWYANIAPQTVVWVANRRSPVVNGPGVLRMAAAAGRLVVVDGQNATVWTSAGPTRNATAGARATARLLDSGNLVLSSDGSGSPQSVVWQSFDYPTDTLLPGMKLGVDARSGISRNMSSWSSEADPSPGLYTFKLVPGGLPEFFLFKGATKVYASGPWNGEVLTGVPGLKAESFTFTVVWNADETYYSYSIVDPSRRSRFVVDGTAGTIGRLVWLGGVWTSFWYYPNDPCDGYAKCGAFGYCVSGDTGQSPPCACLPGFRPRSPEQWDLRDASGGCVRRTNLSCGDGDGFWAVNRMKLPETTNATVLAGVATLDQCRQACLRDCGCRAYAAANVSGGVSRGCVIWDVDLLDMRLYTLVVQDVYIRLAQSDVDALTAAAGVDAVERRQERGSAGRGDGRQLPLQRGGEMRAGCSPLRRSAASEQAADVGGRHDAGQRERHGGGAE